ncbi:MAG: hypothetical protein JRN15_05435 [Nitrososphaerota archaeon]|jgi:hypothetical protein|nr:hypothetical protein [Nitrososphaerota archaeon]
MIGEDLSFIHGRSFLLEIDPSTAYERSVSSFTDELSKAGSTIFVCTHRSSPVYKFLSSEKFRFFLSTDTVSYIRQTDRENEVLIPQNDFAILLEVISKSLASSGGSVVFVIDSISDMLVSSGFESTYKALKNANEVLAGPNVTSLFIMTRSIHDQKIVAAIRSLFSTHLQSGVDGTVKLLRKS